MSPIIYIICTLCVVITASKHPSMLHTKSEMEEMECIPGQRVQMDCQECFCAAGVVTNCINTPCAGEKKQKVSPSDPEIIPTRMMKDRPACTLVGEYFKNGCELCYCSKLGQLGLCTPCKDPELDEQIEDFDLEN